MWVMRCLMVNLGSLLLQTGIILRLVYNGPTEEGTNKFQRFVDLGPVTNMSETIREFPSRT